MTSRQKASGSGQGRSGGGPRRAAALLTRVMAPEARRRGFVEASLLSDWAEIVGEDLAARCRPVRIRHARGRGRGGVLHLHASGPAALMVQHNAPSIIERVNLYFGHIAVASIRLIQAPVPVPRRQVSQPRPAPSTPERQARVAAMVAEVEDPDLRATLERLGHALQSRPARAVRDP